MAGAGGSVPTDASGVGDAASKIVGIESSDAVALGVGDAERTIGDCGAVETEALGVGGGVTPHAATTTRMEGARSSFRIIDVVGPALSHTRS